MQPPSSSRQNLQLHQESATLQFVIAGAVVLMSGRIALYRSPLIGNLRYSFSAGSCIMLEAFEDAVVQIEGTVQVTVGPINSTIDELHALLDTARVDAAMAIEERQRMPLATSEELKESWQGPRVLVVGESQWERETIVRSLLNLAVRRGSTFGVALVDVDVSMPLVSCPGTVSIAFVEEPVAAPESFDALMPLAFFHGDASVTSRTRKRYLDLCVCAAEAATAHGFAEPAFEGGGLLIHTMTPTTELQRALLSDHLAIFSITHVVVTGGDYDLEKTLVNAALGRNVTFLRAPQLRGALKPTVEVAERWRRSQLETYFYGRYRSLRLPLRGVVRTDDVVLVDAETFQPMSWEEVPDLAIASVVWADTIAAAAEANVAGFLVLLEVGKQFMSFLAPSGGELPKPFLVVSRTLQLPRELVMPLYATESA